MGDCTLYQQSRLFNTNPITDMSNQTDQLLRFLHGRTCNWLTSYALIAGVS